MADLIDSLIGYVNDVKPYHTKIFGVEVEYVTEERVDVTVGEDFQMKIFMGLPVNEMKQLGEWSRERWIPGISGPRYDSISDGATWDNKKWDGATLGNPNSATNPGVPIDRRNKTQEAIIRTLYGEIGWEALAYDAAKFDRDMFVDESFRSAMLYPYPSGFMDIVYTKITESIKFNLDVVGGDVADEHNFTMPLWDEDVHGLNIIGTTNNAFYVEGDVESILNQLPTVTLRPSKDMNVGWGTASLDQRLYDEFNEQYTVINAVYNAEVNATILRVVEDVPTVVAGSHSYGHIEVGMFDAGEWDGYQSTYVEQPDADVNATSQIAETLEMVDGYTYDDHLAGGLDAVGWDDGTHLLKGQSAVQNKYDGFDKASYDTELWDAEPYFVRELFDAQGYDVGLLDSGSPVKFIEEDEVGVIVFSYDDVPRPSYIGNGTVGASYSEAEAKRVWVINHNMGYHPIVRTFDGNGNRIEPRSVIHNTKQTTTIEFSRPTEGHARLI